MASAAVVGAVVGGTAFKAGVTWFGSTFLASALTGASLGQALFGRRSKAKYLFDESSMNTWSEGVSIPINYGKAAIAGNVIYKRVSADSKRLYMAIAFGEGELTSIEDIWADGEPLGDMNSGYVKHEVRLGTSDQAPVLWLFNENPKSDGAEPIFERWKNTAYVALCFEASESIWSLPTITAIVEGTKVKTIASGGQWVTTFSRNPIWCLYDLITNTRYGVGLKESVIDVHSWRDAAEYCDQLVDEEPRFQLDLSINDQMSSLDLIDSILVTCRGHLIYSEGKLRVMIEQDEIPVQAFTPKNIIKDSFSFHQTSKNEVPNQVVVEWLDPEDDWAFTSTEWNNEIDQEDRGIIPQSLELRGIIRASQAGRMARYILDDLTQCRITCQFGVGIDALACEVGDVIKVSHFVSGWHEKLFRIMQIEETEQDEMTITAREHNPLVYHDRGVTEQRKHLPAEPDPVSPPSAPKDVVARAMKIGNQIVLAVQWESVEHSFGITYDVRFTQGSIKSWSVINTQELYCTITGLAAGEVAYMVQVRAISGLGQQSLWTEEVEIDLTSPTLMPFHDLVPGNTLYPVN